MNYSSSSTLLRGSLLVLLSLFASGCVLAPVIDGVQQLGISKSDRERMLSETLSQFHNAIYWGKPQLALGFASEDFKEGLKDYVRSARRSEKLVGSEPEFIDFDEDARTAVVDVLVKYYRIPHYVVQEKTNREKWIFSMTDGWKIDSLEPLGTSQY